MVIFIMPCLLYVASMLVFCSTEFISSNSNEELLRNNFRIMVKKN